MDFHKTDFPSSIHQVLGRELEAVGLFRFLSSTKWKGEEQVLFSPQGSVFRAQILQWGPVSREEGDVYQLEALAVLVSRASQLSVLGKH